jgi:SAM-dependent methyltransferase
MNIQEMNILEKLLVCPACHGRLAESETGLACGSCGNEYSSDSRGFLQLLLDESLYEKVSTTEEHARAQSSDGADRVDKEYIIPYLMSEGFQRVLDVGCGIGRTMSRLIEQGYDAYGIDLPILSEFWAQAGNDPGRFFCSDATRLPFADNSFDAVISMGVIEHIGTSIGHCSLGPDYQRERQRYADELQRVTRPGGRILVSCPNKRFPLDPQHKVLDELSPDSVSYRIRDAVFGRTGMNVHRTWGKYHLLSYPEVRRLFCDNGRNNSFEPLPLKGFFGLTSFRSGYLKPFQKMADYYINNMPGLIRTSFLNPYLLVQIRKGE